MIKKNLVINGVNRTLLVEDNENRMQNRLRRGSLRRL